MISILNCIQAQHDISYVVLAALLCIAASSTTVFLYDWSKRARSETRWIWLLCAGIDGGFGIWSTHFVAMLGYRGSEVIGYDLFNTLNSLALSIAGTTLAVFLAQEVRSRLLSSLVAGLVLGAGIVTMHYVGMMAVVIPGSLQWSMNYVALSMVFSVGFSIASFMAASLPRSTTRLRLVSATVALVLGIVLLHFTGMTAIHLVPGPIAGTSDFQMSPVAMAVMIVSACLSLLGAGSAAASFAMRSERAVAAGAENFRLLVQGVKDYAIYMLDPQGHVSNWNLGAERAKGYTAAEIVGRHFEVFYSEEERKAGLPAEALRQAREHGSFEAHGWRYRKGGSRFWAHVVLEPMHDDEGLLIGFTKITKDGTREKEAEDRLRTLSGNLDAALENMSHGICMFDADERLVFANRRYGQILRLPEGMARSGMTYDELLSNWFTHAGGGDPQGLVERRRNYRERVMNMIAKGGGTFVQKMPSGRSLQMHYNPMEKGGWVATFEDVTERLRSEEKIAHMAQHDSLTGLANRSYFNDYLEVDLDHCRTSGNRLAVIAIDLNKFKEINDQHGHPVGDAVLKAVADAMQACLRTGEFIARLGGDEFAATKRFQDMAELHDFIARLENALSATIHHESFELKIGGSLGVALFPEDAATGGQLMANADLAMYRAKNSLLHHVCFYEPRMDETARVRRHLASELWQALDRQQFVLHYQIQRSVSTGETTGHEALLRWVHPERGNVPPMDFIPLAEECGAILPIGEWVLRTACREAMRWPDGGKIAVNLSPVQIAHSDMPALVKAVLEETGLSPERLELEITESAIIVDKDLALRSLRDIKALGVSIAIDDFGTGYSSLETLRSFPFDKIKLDRSFMAELEEDQQAKAIVRAILALGKSLGVTVLAEGVETTSQLEVLFAEGCQEAQGYLLGRPSRPVFEDAPREQTAA